MIESLISFRYKTTSKNGTVTVWELHIHTLIIVSVKLILGCHRG